MNTTVLREHEAAKKRRDAVLRHARRNGRRVRTVKGGPLSGVRLGMNTTENFHKNCKTFIEQLVQIERHIKDQTIYTSFDFGKLSSCLAQYQVWAQANVGVIDAALSTHTRA
jgi:hypothetical protein